jgi:hypothetical protein
MTFGTASLGRARKNHRGSQGPRYDCGEHGQLSVTEIAMRLGMTRTAVKNRIVKGWRGDRLMQPKHATRTEIRTNRPPAKHMLVAALRIAHQFPDRLPTLEEIQAIRPMSSHYAVQWRQAISHARAAA